MEQQGLGHQIESQNSGSEIQNQTQNYQDQACILRNQVEVLTYRLQQLESKKVDESGHTKQIVSLYSKEALTNYIISSAASFTIDISL